MHQRVIVFDRLAEVIVSCNDGGSKQQTRFVKRKKVGIAFMCMK